MDREDRRKEKALLRYQIISPLINEEFKRGEKKRCLEKLSLKEWTLSTGEVSCFSIDTIRAWLRRYHCNGFEALYDKVYSEQPSKLPMDIIEEACRLKREVPERSLDKIIMIIENLQKADPGVVRRSTLHRALQARGISMRKLPASGTKDLERFSADYANDLWQSDMLAGPWLPDPNNEGKMRRCWLYAFIDDASRLILYGRFFFKGDLPALELVFKRSLQRFGVPQRVYYDNGAVYRSIHMRSACAELGIKPPVFTKPYRPMGHGKIEAFNRFCNNNFIAETKASHISTLDELNEAFVAWLEEEYNHRPNTELGMTPHARWSRDDKRIQYIDEEKLRVAFLWREQRTPDKCGILSLFNREYKVSSLLGKKRVDIRYCPDEDLDEIEVWYGGKFRERAKTRPADKPFRGPSIKEPAHNSATLLSEKTDYLSHLVNKRRGRLGKEIVTPADKINGHDDFLNLLSKSLSRDIFDKTQALQFYRRFGPFNLEKVEKELKSILQTTPDNLHIQNYLDGLSKVVNKIGSPS